MSRELEMGTIEGDGMTSGWKRRLAPPDLETRGTSLKALAIVVAGGGLLMALLITVYLTRMPWPA
jgi:hypothetical protein